MLTRRSFVKLLAGAAAGLFAGKARAVEAVQPETPFTRKIEKVCIGGVTIPIRDCVLEPTEGMIAFWKGDDVMYRTTELPVYEFTGEIVFGTPPSNSKCDICGRPAPDHWSDLHWCEIGTT